MAAKKTLEHPTLFKDSSVKLREDLEEMPWQEEKRGKNKPPDKMRKAGRIKSDCLK